MLLKFVFFSFVSLLIPSKTWCGPTTTDILIDEESSKTGDLLHRRPLAGERNDMEMELKALRKEVTTLLERRREDLASIEESMRRKLMESDEMRHLKSELNSLRAEMERIQNGVSSSSSTPLQVHHHNHQQQHARISRQEKNDHLTVKWLSHTMKELRTEFGEVQAAVNATIILQNHERVDTELSLLKSDVANLNRELDGARRRTAKYEAEMQMLREELKSVRDQGRTTGVLCGRVKNQLKASQFEWNQNWQNLLNERGGRRLATMDEGNRIIDAQQHNTATAHRHQRVLRRHVAELQRTARELVRDNEQLKSKVQQLGDELSSMTNSVKTNEVETDSDGVVSMKNFTAWQRLETLAIANLTRQASNFDRLHLSMLELLENVESIENRVDRTLPEFRKEISKVEIQAADSLAQIGLLREDEQNMRKTIKAIGVSVSNAQDKSEVDRKTLASVESKVAGLVLAATMQTSKLHDHIQKSESSTLDVNATKSTIHLVQELRSFENEYKSIVNKLPHDCSAVAGPSGIYLISPDDTEPILAHCHDGWTTVQRRFDGSVNFNRDWNEYANGFGSATGEHWLGNRILHSLTANTNCSQLRIDMRDIYGKHWRAVYDSIVVGDYADGFRLDVRNYSGNASDALDYQNHMEFSTVDNDRDISNTHCAVNYEGGWWFSHCQHANLNGRYNLGLTWFDSARNEWIAVSQSEMRVRRRETC